MPFKSKAQRRKFAELLVNGKITPEVFEEWNRETGSAKLPERVKPRGKKKSSKQAKRKPAGPRKTASPRKTVGRKTTSKRSTVKGSRAPAKKRPIRRT